MATYVDKLRRVTATESDDFFTENTLVDYLNHAKNEVVSTLIRTEKNDRVSSRGLDSLRNTTLIDLEPISFSGANNVFKGEVNFPADQQDYQYLLYNNTPLIEIKHSRIDSFYNGNLRPTQYEGYYTAQDGKFDLYLHENPNKELKLYYIKTPEALTSSSETLIDIPERFEKAVLYSAAHQMILQESAGEPREVINISFREKYNEEIQTQLY